MSRAQRDTGFEDANHRSVVVGTAGHIDHGKTSLVYALTGTDTDRLPEEKRRGMTIDLGFASLLLPDGNGGLWDISIVDVPGHRAFVRNMLAGAGGIDCVMLIIAADEGVMPQTEEHLTICSLLGISKGIVVLTKADTVGPEEIRQVSDSIRIFLRHTFLEDAPILAVSARTGKGLPELKKELAALTCGIPKQHSESITRLPLDRAFSVRGFGTVVTGTLHSGEIREGDALIQYPGGRSVRVRGVQVHRAARKFVHAPCRVALNVPNLEVSEIERGDVLTPPHTVEAGRTIDAVLKCLPGTRFLHRSKVRLHAFASESLATVLLYNHDESAAAEETMARIRLQTPLVLLPGDRFVLRQCSPEKTMGGGVVLDASPLPRTKKTIAHDFLCRLRSADRTEQLRLRVARRGASSIGVAGLLAETGLTSDAITRALDLLASSGKIIGAGHHGSPTERFMSAEAALSLQNVILRELERAASGCLTRSELATKIGSPADFFEILLQSASDAGKVTISGNSVALAGKPVSVDDELVAGIRTVEAIYAESGLASPSAAEVAQRLGLEPRLVHQIVTHLLRSKRLVHMGADDAFTHVNALEALYATLRGHRGERFDVARFKSFTGLTRKHAIPLLEHLDRVWVTRNTGGVRTVI